MRAAKENDLIVTVDGFGEFRFARRQKEDVYKIRSRYAVLSGLYNDDGSIGDLGALGLVTIQTLMVSSPETFDLDALDPLMDDDYESKILKVYFALRVKEVSFRPKKAAAEPAATVAEPVATEAPAEPAAAPHAADTAPACDAQGDLLS